MADNKKDNKEGRECLIRYAAGSYWIIDNEQDWSGYVPPVSVNRTGMYILGKLRDGYTEEEIAEDMHARYDVGLSEVLDDIRYLNTMMAKTVLNQEIIAKDQGI